MKRTPNCHAQHKLLSVRVRGGGAVGGKKGQANEGTDERTDGRWKGRTDCHVNSIFVLPCAATSFSQRVVGNPSPLLSRPLRMPEHGLSAQRHFMYIIIIVIINTFLPGAIYTPSSILVSRSNQHRQHRRPGGGCSIYLPWPLPRHAPYPALIHLSLSH